MKNYILLICFMMTAGMVSAQALKVASNSNVGIGTANPITKLHLQDGFFYVNETRPAERAKFIVQHAATGFNFEFQQDNGGNTIMQNWNDNGTVQYYQNGAGLFAWNVNGAFHMALDANGNVGIGNTTPTAKLDVSGVIKHAGLDGPSDKRLKKNIKTYRRGLEDILKLNPVTYQYNGKSGITNSNTLVGIIAQDLQKVAPEMVKSYIYSERMEAKDGLLMNKIEKNSEVEYLSIQTDGIQYMLINAIKDQQELIKELREELNLVKNALTSQKMDGEDGSIVEVELSLNNVSYIEQNQPNPFTSESQISYAVKNSAKSALLQIFDVSGRLIKTVSLGTGSGVVDMKAQSLNTGNYSYSLVVDGKVIETKRMVVAK